MRLPKGHYVTAAGSQIEIFGKYGMAWRGTFDRLEEDCCDWCNVVDVDDGCLVWECECCGGGRAELKPVED